MYIKGEKSHYIYNILNIIYTYILCILIIYKHISLYVYIGIYYILYICICICYICIIYVYYIDKLYIFKNK